VANASPAELADWYDPDRGDRYPLDRTSMLLGYLGAVATSPLSAAEKAAGTGLVARWLLSDRQWRVIGGELKRRALGSARRPRHSRVVDPS
jgi:hypothetical protein